MNVDKNLEVKEVIHDNIKWYNTLNGNINIYGLNWINQDHIYNRLPKSKFKEISEVSQAVLFLGTNTSGGQLHFYTNSKKLIIHAKVTKKAEMSGMTAISQAGFDCYVGSSYSDLKFYASTNFNIELYEYEAILFDNQPSDNKLVVINMPLYGGLDFIEVGIEKDATISPAQFKNNQRVVLYGTSITQGGCASRPGLSYSNILSRKWQQEFLNFGFSGNAFGEKIFAQILSTIENVEMYIINYEANAGTNGKLYLTLEDFIKTIRKEKQTTPIFICSRIKYLFDDLNKTMGENREKIRVFQEEMVTKFKTMGDENIYYIDGRKLLGDNYHEYTVDGIHPTDAGFLKIAEVLNQEINKILKK